jgi:hypothetical protein
MFNLIFFHKPSADEFYWQHFWICQQNFSVFSPPCLDATHSGLIFWAYTETNISRYHHAMITECILGFVFYVNLPAKCYTTQYYHYILQICCWILYVIHCVIMQKWNCISQHGTSLCIVVSSFFPNVRNCIAFTYFFYVKYYIYVTA